MSGPHAPLLSFSEFTFPKELALNQNRDRKLQVKGQRLRPVDIKDARDPAGF